MANNINKDFLEIVMGVLGEDEIKKELNAPLINMLKSDDIDDNLYGKEEKFEKEGYKEI